VSRCRTRIARTVGCARSALDPIVLAKDRDRLTLDNAALRHQLAVLCAPSNDRTSRPRTESSGSSRSGSSRTGRRRPFPSSPRPGPGGTARVGSTTGRGSPGPRRSVGHSSASA
jgi:hypothetical protein